MKLCWHYFRLLFDDFTLTLVAVVALASLLPAHGAGAIWFGHLTTAAIALLFFMHGAKLSRQAIWDGLTHWRLHTLVFAFTFLAFPLIALICKPLLEPLLGHELYIGMIFLCALPGTVQSAIAFTSLARGNVPAAVCSASASSIIGILATPVLVALLVSIKADQGIPLLESIVSISAELLLPFVVGHLARPLIGRFMDRNRPLLNKVDQGSILLVVYTALSESVVTGLWTSVSPQSLILLTLTCCVLLAIALGATAWLGRRLRFNREDQITIVFCASKKSMATGVPMAQLLFTGALLGPALLPLMIYHQIQLMVCAVLAQRYAAHAVAREYADQSTPESA